MGAALLVALEVGLEGGGGVGVAAAPGLVVDDGAFETVVGVDVANEAVEGLSWAFGYVALPLWMSSMPMEYEFMP